MQPEPAPLKKADQPADSSTDMQVLRRSRPTTAVNMRRLAFETTEPIQFVDITDEVADLVRQALKVIPAERLVLSSDCGMGREGMSRRHSFYKMVALVQGTNIVKKELGLPVTDSLAADPKLSLLRTT